MREARTVSSLNHANICTVFDIGEQDGEPYLVMELLQGESLKDCLARGPMLEGDIWEIAFRVALALQAAHAKGVIHRDIKPANLYLFANNLGSMDVKVLDFGLAKMQDDGSAETRGLTRAGGTVGTVEYMSPEQARGQTLDTRSDLFSLGAVLYEMATGRLPFSGATSAVVFSELLNRDPVPPREANLNVSWELDRIIRSLLAKQPAQRIQSAGDLLEALGGGCRKVAIAQEMAARDPAGKTGGLHGVKALQPVRPELSKEFAMAAAGRAKLHVPVVAFAERQKRSLQGAAQASAAPSGTRQSALWKMNPEPPRFGAGTVPDTIREGNEGCLPAMTDPVAGNHRTRLERLHTTSRASVLRFAEEQGSALSASDDDIPDRNPLWIFGAAAILVAALLALVLYALHAHQW